jgi:squalene synthase HpnC
MEAMSALDAARPGARASWQAREAGENFPVALRLLPARLREDLHAVYGYARLVDELGDSYPGDRVAALNRLREQVTAIWVGATPAAPVLAELARIVHARDLSRQPFLDLIEANLHDQRVTSYATVADLVGYCRLSADPVGRIVLELLGASTPARVALSDRVCTALQLVEHLQDVAEDRRAGRVYLPQESLRRYGVADAELDLPSATLGLRACVLAETGRAEGWLREGSALVGTLGGWGRVAVAGFVAGGLATAAALRRTGGDVLAYDARPAKAETARIAAVLLVRGHA